VIGADLAVMVVWGFVAAIIAVRTFRWEPSGGDEKS
jgi:hypothetical protein